MHKPRKITFLTGYQKENEYGNLLRLSGVK